MDRTIMSTTGLHIRRPPLFPASVYLAVTFIVLYIRAVRRVNHIDTPTARRKKQISAHYHLQFLPGSSQKPHFHS